MPNHITNLVRIAGPKKKLAELKKRLGIGVIPSNANRVSSNFDFNGVIPMPPELNIESGSSVAYGLAAFDPTEFSANASFPKVRQSGANTMEEWREWLRANEPDILKVGEQAFKNRQAHGYTHWYGWCVDNWGTKWNAYDVEILKNTSDELVVQFLTAWSSPKPIFDKLVEEGFEVDCRWLDECGPDGEYGNDPGEYFYIERRLEYYG